MRHTLFRFLAFPLFGFPCLVFAFFFFVSYFSWHTTTTIHSFYGRLKKTVSSRRAIAHSCPPLRCNSSFFLRKVALPFAPPLCYKINWCLSFMKDNRSNSTRKVRTVVPYIGAFIPVNRKYQRSNVIAVRFQNCHL